MARFLAMAVLKQAWLCSSGLTKTFHFMARFLAMAELKQAWLCSSGLMKTLDYLVQKLCRFFARNRVRKGGTTGAERRKWSEGRGVRHLSSCDSLPFEARKLRDRVAKGKVLSLD